MANLIDNIKNDDFDITSFIDTNEAVEYLGKLPGIKDLIDAGKTLFKNVQEFIDKLKEFISEILDLFDLSGFFSGDSLDKLFGTVSGWVDDNMGVKGIPLELKQVVTGAFSALCGTFNGNLKNTYGTPNDFLQSYTVMGVLLAMLCNGVDNAYSGLIDSFKGKVNEDTSYMTATELSEYDAKKDKHDKGVDAMFSKTLSPVLVNMAGKSNSSFIKDLNSQTNMLEQVGKSSKSVGTVLLNGLDGFNLQTVSPTKALLDIDNVLDKVSPGTTSDVSKLKQSAGYVNLAKASVKSIMPDMINGPREPDAKILCQI